MRDLAKEPETKWRAFLNNYSTALVTAMFAVVGVSGMLMFFGVHTGGLHGLHEWLGVGLVASVGLHMTRHLRSLARLVTQTRALAVFAGILLLTVVLLAAAPSGQGGAQHRHRGQVLDNAVTQPQTFAELEQSR